jgi:hypothetical protein
MGRAGFSRRQRRHRIVFQPAAKQRSRPPPVGHPRGTAHRDRHLDRTHLPPPPTPGSSRTVDPDRIRSKHDHTGPPGRVAETVTGSCSRPDRPVNGFPAGVGRDLRRTYQPCCISRDGSAKDGSVTPQQAPVPSAVGAVVGNGDVPGDCGLRQSGAKRRLR